MKKLLYIFVTTFLSFEPGFYGQTDQANHYKYWFYKSRLNNDFVKVGLKAGESIPFNQRGAYVTDFYPENVQLMAGDATATIGYYIALLATEYYLLKENGQDVAKTKHELFCALNALNRLDYIAEGIYEPGTENLNGFFVRDDIPSSFISDPEYYNHFNYYNQGLDNNKNSRGFNSWFQTGANIVTSSWIAYATKGADISMSQDQVYCVLFGLAFVSRFVPPGETDGDNVFGYGSGESSLTAEARNIAGRIIGYMRNPKKTDGEPCAPTSTGWNIKDPVNCEEVPTGNDAHSFAYALGEAECYIRYPGIYAKNGSRRTNIPASCSGKGFHNVYSKTVGFQLWNASAKSLIYLPSNSHYGADTRSQIANMSAICNCVYGTVADGIVQRGVSGVKNVRILNWAGQTVNFLWMAASGAVSTFIPGAYVNQTRMAINMTSYINGTGSPSNPLGDPGCPLDHAPLARKLLHGSKYDKNKKYRFEYLLDVAPCDNIYNLNNLNWGHYEWSADNRLDRPDRRGWYGKNYESGNPFNSQRYRPPSGEYHGIDYMLYHNLWYIHRLQEGSKQNMVDLSDVQINSGGQMHISSIGAFETIIAKDVKVDASSSELSWRAGKIIHFGPGTEIYGNFHAHIDRFTCATDIALPGESGSELNLPDNDTTSVKNEHLMIEGNLNIIPNPSDGRFEVHFELEKNERIFIHVFNMQGELVNSIPSAGRTDSGLIFDLRHYPDGVYILKAYTTLGRLMTKKIIKI